MLSITCTQCQAVLEIDDAFAGGVCRCQHCGTIQTVPSHLKTSATSTAPTPYVGPSAAASKALYQNKSAASGQSAAAAAGVSSSPSGLDELAQVVASSGLAGSGLRSSRLTKSDAVSAAAFAAPVMEPPIRKSNKLPVLPIAIGGGIVLAAIVGVILFVTLHGGKSDAAGGAAGAGPTAPAGTPAFLGAPLAGTHVVYLLDRANSLHDLFDTIRAATYQSIVSLGPDHKFAVLLWNNGGDDVAFPDAGMRAATTDQLGQLKDQIGEIPATGTSHLAGALELAKARAPDALLIVTAKTSLDPDDSDALAKFQDVTRNKIPLNVYVVGNTDNDVLKMAAKATNGRYNRFTDHELRSMVP